MNDIPEELRTYIIINKILADCFNLYVNIFYNVTSFTWWL